MRTALWTTANKRKIRVCDMETSHLRNTIAMMDRELGAHYRTAERNAVPIYHDMKAELAERETIPVESSNRAIIEAQRAGYVAGAQAAAGSKWTAAKQFLAIAEAETQYPLTVEQPRVLRATRPKMRRVGNTWVRCGDEPVEYRVVGGKQQFRTPGAIGYFGEWRPTNKDRAELVRMVELFDNPTETVEIK